MINGIPCRVWRLVRQSGLFAGLSLMVALLTIAPVVAADGAGMAGPLTVDASGVICQPQPLGSRNDRPSMPHHLPDCALCVMAVGSTWPAILPVADPVPPQPRVAVPARAQARPAARAPPSQCYAIAYPRGPPVPV